jgi:hypothetical protein
MRVVWALAIGLALGLAGGLALAESMAKATGAATPFSLFHPAPCGARIERTIAFTAPDARDVLTVQSAGVSCENLVARVTIKSAAGHIVFAHADRIDALMDPKRNPVAVKGVRAVLNDYVALAEGGARAALPAWTEGTCRIPASAPYATLTPIAGNTLYRRVRDANAPILRLRLGKDTGVLFAYLSEIDDSEEIARYAL